MPIRGVRQLSDALTSDGSFWYSYFHKTGGPALIGAGRWGDMSMGAGTPKYNAYVGGQTTATPLSGSGNDGIFLGPTPPAGQTKHIHSLALQSSSTVLAPSRFILCDYLLHYPLVDGDSTDQQDMDNTLSIPRYADGAGVQCMVVCTTPMSANAVATVSYVNQAGDTKTSTFSLLFSTAVGAIISSSDTSNSANSGAPFIPLAGGDTGIRSINSITLSSGAGGFFALVLVKPLFGINLTEANTATESFLLMNNGASMPKVENGAYLNFIYITGGTGSAVTLRGELVTVWK